jgi:BirA family transcriptional regulator, biotin operon repressor / biotin---[acetyl-CoA-carboxylase] ligase
VADIAGENALVKWPNDMWVNGRKVAGILAESRGDAGWAVLGIGVNVAVDVDSLPEDAAKVAGTLGKAPEDVEATLQELLAALANRLGEDRDSALAALRERDALRGVAVRWQDGEGNGAGIADDGALLVNLPDGHTISLHAGEVTLSAG